MSSDYLSDYEVRFSKCTDEKLLDYFNRLGPSSTPAAKILSVLTRELKKRNIDYSAGFDGLIKIQVELKTSDGEKKFVPVKKTPTTITGNSIGDKDSIDVDLDEWDEEESEQESDESEGDPFCPICDMECYCDHLLIIYDKTYKSFEGGEVYEHTSKFSNLIISGLTDCLKSKRNNIQFLLKSLNTIWIEMNQHENPDEMDAYISTSQLFDLFSELFVKHGGVWGEDGYTNSGPGYSSLETYMFAENPEDTINKALIELQSEFKVE